MNLRIALKQRVRSLTTAILLAVMVCQPTASGAEPVAVRHVEGSVRGFLALRSPEGKILAIGDLVQVTHGNRVVSHLVFRFKDGSVDDETAVFSQRGIFRLVSDHHVQKGPAFKHPIDVAINTATGEVRTRSTEDGKETVETSHLDLPSDLANGLILNVMKNIRPADGEMKVSYVASTPKPRLIKLVIRPEGEDTFSLVGSRRKAVRYVVKVELGGMVGFIAPIFGKQPLDTHIWILGGDVPAFVRSEGPLSLDGPLWRIELISPAWQELPSSGH